MQSVCTSLGTQVVHRKWQLMSQFSLPRQESLSWVPYTQAALLGWQIKIPVWILFWTITMQLVGRKKGCEDRNKQQQHNTVVLDTTDLPQLRMGLSPNSQLLSHVWLFVTPWTKVCQEPLSMEFSKQEHWSGLPFPSPRDLPNLRIEPGSPALQADSLPSEPAGKPK